MASVTEQLRKAKRELRACKRRLKEAEALNERLRASIGYDELLGWKPQERIERQYGWPYAWLYPLRSYMSQHMHDPLTPDIRNRINGICTAIIRQLAVKGKYGVELPIEVPMGLAPGETPRNLTQGPKQEWDPCVVCGENRISHECHIIPRVEGGPYNRSNFVTLCPLHHHLFDHHRLLPDEWETLMAVVEAIKMESSIVYCREVRLPALERFWADQNLSPG